MTWFDTFKENTTLTLNPLGFLSGLARNRQAKSSAQAQMDFQERMANTAHQRQMADLKKAGLNPILGFSSGMGGSPSPSGAMYNPENVGLSTAQSTSALAQAKLTDTQAEIEKRTLAMLRKKNITMAEIQYTATNILGSQLLGAFEGAISGDMSQVSKPYTPFAKKIQEYIRNSGAYDGVFPVTGATGNVYGKNYKLDLSGRKLFFLYMEVMKIATEMGVEGAAYGSAAMFEALKNQLGVK